jgi:TamB, inner membrane protein subunit of TAM complex
MPPRRQLRRWAVACAVGFAVLLALVLGSARMFLHGEDLGDFVASMLNRKMRGRIEIGSIEWPMASIPTMISGGWVPVTVRNVRLWDDCMQSPEGRRQRTIVGNQAGTQASSQAGVEGGGGTQLFVAELPCAPDNRRAAGLTPRKKLLDAAYITAEIDVHALFFGNHDLTFRHVRVHGGEVLLEQSAEPYPLHDYDKTTISLITAFQPRMKAGFRAGIFADKAPPIFDLRDIHLEGIGVTYHHRPEFSTVGGNDRARYPITLHAENVRAASGDATKPAFLYADNSDALVGKLYLSVPLLAGAATLRIDDEGPAEDFEIGALSPEQKARRKPRYLIDIASIDMQRLAQLPRHWAKGDPIARTLELRLTAKTAQGGIVNLGGELKDYWDRPFSGTWALDAVAENLGPTVTASIDPALSGANLSAKLRLRGPFIANPKIEYEASGIEYETLRPKEPIDPPALRLALARLKGELDLVNDQGFLEETIAQVLGDDGQPSRGKIRLDATFGLKPYQINNADVQILEAIDLGRFLPESARRHLGRYVRGNFSGTGDTISGFALRDIDLTIGQRPTDVTARLYGGRIFTTDNFSTLEVAREQPLRARVGETSTTISGSILARTRWLKLKLAGVESPDLGRWLLRLGVSPIATSASDGSVDIVGPMLAPSIDATATLAGVPILGQAQLSAHFENQTLDITSVQSGNLGGSLSGSGRIRLSPGQAPFVERLAVTGQRLSADKMAAAGGLVGKASGTINTVEISARGSLGRRDNPLDWIDLVDAYVQADRVTVAGEAYDDIGLCISRSSATRPQCRRRDDALGEASEARCAELRRQGGTCVMGHATRQDGGDLDLSLGKVPGALLSKNRRAPSTLIGSIDISALPLRILDRIAGPGTFGGTVGALLTIGGTAEAPTATGSIDLLRGWAKGAFFGDSRLTVTPVGRTLEIAGSALGGRLVLKATVGTAAPFPIDVLITGRRIELDPLLAGQLASLPYPVRGWASGEIRLRADLSPDLLAAKPREPEAWIELSELEALVDYRDGDQPSPLRFAAHPISQRRPALSMRLTPTSFELACRDVDGTGTGTGTSASASGRVPCPARIATPAGVIMLSGSANLREIKLLAEGNLDLSLLGALVAQQFDELSGAVAVRAEVGGTLAVPTPIVEVRLNNLRARPTGLETVVQVPTGLIRLANDSVGFTGVRVLVDDTHLKEGGELTIGGNITLKNWEPAQWAVIVTGKIAGKLLLAVAPQAISQASGLATIDQSAALIGKGRQPSISATLLFDASQPLSIIPRGFRRELSFRGGSLEVETGTSVGATRTYQVSFNDVAATIDGEGTLSHIQGDVALRDGTPVEADVRLDVNAIPFRVPGTLDLLLTGRDLRLRLPPAGRAWQAEGNIEIVNGKYIRNFDPSEFLRPTTPPAGSNRPFWEEWPQIGNAELGLKVGVRQMAVANNIADIDLNGELSVTGSPRDPRIAGAISVQRGTFRMQGTRASFTRTKGTVDFSPRKTFPEQTPSLDIESEADYRDPTGRDHLITLRVQGTLFAPEWDLRTSTGYNKSQTLALIFFGRTPEQVRQSIGDTAVGGDPTRIDPTTNPSAGAADQLIKDFAGNWVSLLLGNSLEDLTGLDVLRFQVDFGSIGLRGEKKLFENVRSVVNLEQTVRGSTVNADIEVRTPFRITLKGTYLNKNFDSEAEEDIRDRQLKLVYRFFIP